MSDLAIYRQVTGEREQNAQNTAKLPITPFSGNYGSHLSQKPTLRPCVNCELPTIQNLSMTRCAFLGIHAQFVATLLY